MVGVFGDATVEPRLTRLGLSNETGESCPVTDVDDAGHLESALTVELSGAHADI